MRSTRTTDALVPRWASVACLLCLACGQSNEGGSGLPSSDAGADTASREPEDSGVTANDGSVETFPLSGDKRLESCRGLGSVSETCEYRYVYREACTQQKCSKLVVYFSGGQMSCPDPASQPMSYLARYADDGYVAVCAKLFETSDAAALVPYQREASRVDAILKAVTTDPAILQGWTGEHLLLSGVSHGATAPVIAMARNTYDETSPAWKGKLQTAACFYDGIYDARLMLTLLSAATDTTPPGNSCDLYARMYTRYCPWPGDPNVPATWPHPTTCQASDVALDTVDAKDVAQLAITDWKLIECGSAAATPAGFCTFDMVPAAPIAKLCAAIENSAGRTCSFESFPGRSHIACGSDDATVTTCLTWFDRNVDGG